MTQKDALDILKLGHNVYLTGSAGSGKTYVLNQYIHYLKQHEIAHAVTASTGIAASHMNGVTIHSWSGLGIRSTLSPYDLEAMEEKRYLWERFKNTKVLIIDEVSMLHHFRLDLVDEIARFFKRNDKPFGGLQVVLCGDFFQLPPVSKSHEEEARFIYESDAWKNLNLKICYLEGSYRQTDSAFLDVLNGIRTNSISNEIRAHLDTRMHKDIESDVKPTKLFTHNVDVDGLNAEELAKTEGEARSYFMKEDGRDVLVAAIKSSCLAPGVLTLKKGAQVMFVKNNYEAGYVNGTLGTVIELGINYPIIKTAQGRIIKAEPMEWTIEDDGTVKAKVKQVPLRLAWAITIHKSQGMTLDAAEIDLSKSFEKGMGYVALSRLKSLEGLKLLGMNEQAFHIDEDVLIFDEKLQEQSAKLSSALKKVSETELKKLQDEFLARAAAVMKTKKTAKIETHLQTRELLLKKLPLKDIATMRSVKVETIISHIEKLQEEGDSCDIEYLKLSAMKPALLKKITEAFVICHKKSGDYSLNQVRTYLKNTVSFSEVRLARLFIEKK